MNATDAWDARLLVPHAFEGIRSRRLATRGCGVPPAKSGSEPLEQVNTGPLDTRLWPEPYGLADNHDALPPHTRCAEQRYLVVAGPGIATEQIGPGYASTGLPLAKAAAGIGHVQVYPLIHAGRANRLDAVIERLEAAWHRAGADPAGPFAYLAAMSAVPGFDARAVPVTADPELALRAIVLGKRLVAAQCGRRRMHPTRWRKTPRGPIAHSHFHHQEEDTTLHVAGAVLEGVNPLGLRARIGPQPILTRWWRARVRDPAAPARQWTPELAERLRATVDRLIEWMWLAWETADLMREIARGPRLDPPLALARR